MLKRVILLLSAALTLWATNGDELIGIGAKSRAMGGTGIALNLGAENGLNNPALIEPESKTEFLLGGTIFMPDLSFAGGDGYQKSAADLSVIPAASFVQKVDSRLSFGVGMFGTAGMGVDYRDDTSGSTMQMVTSLQIMKFAVPISYRFDNNLRIGYTPYIQYSALDINYKEPTLLGRYRGAGLAQDLGIGHLFGAAYRFSGSEPLGRYLQGVRIGLVYRSAVKMHFKDQLRQATELFHLLGYLDDMGETLQQPAEWGIGLSRTWRARHTFAFDWRYLLWSDADGYATLRWSDQHIFALGYAYKGEGWSLRAGYNYATSPIREQEGTTSQGATVNLFNLLGFPATVQQHYTVGGEYRISRHLHLNAAFVYAPKQTRTYDTSGIDPTTLLIFESASVRHAQSSFTITANYSF